ncbi:MAG: hypothetical protein ACK4YP_03480 [Myxococcota bacterium]
MSRLPLLQRAWLALLHVFLVLPFVTVKACEDGVERTYTGLTYYADADRIGLLVVLLLVMGVLVAAPWRGGGSARETAAVGLRAWVATVGAFLAVLGPHLAFLFDTPTPRVGWWIHGGGWALTALGYLGLTAALLARGLRPDARFPVRERWGVVALAAAPFGAVLLKAIFAPGATIGAHAAAFSAGLALCLPLLLAGMALVRAVRWGDPCPRLRAAWWAATLLTLATHLGAAAD